MAAVFVLLAEELLVDGLDDADELVDGLVIWLALLFDVSPVGFDWSPAVGVA